MLLQGYEGLNQREATIFSPQKQRLAESLERLVRFYEAISQPEKGRAWREKLAVRAEAEMPPEIKEAKPELLPLPREQP